MNRYEYAKSVSNRLSEDNEQDSVDSIDPLSFVVTLLPILSNLPCIQNKSPEARRDWIEHHPRLAVSGLAQAIRNKPDAKGNYAKRKKAKELAEMFIEDYLNTDDFGIDEILNS